MSICPVCEESLSWHCAGQQCEPRYLEGPSERFYPCAVYGGVLGTMWRVRDRLDDSYVRTLPERFYARESARLCALSLNRGRPPRVDDVAVYDRVQA